MNNKEMKARQEKIRNFSIIAHIEPTGFWKKQIQLAVEKCKINYLIQWI